MQQTVTRCINDHCPAVHITHKKNMENKTAQHERSTDGKTSNIFSPNIDWLANGKREISEHTYTLLPRVEKKVWPSAFAPKRVGPGPKKDHFSRFCEHPASAYVLWCFCAKLFIPKGGMCIYCDEQKVRDRDIKALPIDLSAIVDSHW